MKKQLMIIGITALLIAVGLSGCTQESSNEESENDTETTDGTSKFIGIWNIDLDGNVSGYTSSFECIDEAWTFYINGTLEILTTYEEGGGIGISKSTWYLEDGKLHTLADYNLLYEFTNSDTHLVLSGTNWAGTERTFILDKVT